MIPRFGITNDRDTKEYFKNYLSIGLRKEFSLGKFVSLNVVSDYSSFKSKLSNPNLNTINLGGGVTLYPFYVIYLIFGKDYDDKIAIKDKFYFDESFSTNLNNTAYGVAGDVTNFKAEVNINQFYLSNNLALSPKIGFSGTVFAKDISGVNINPSFIYLGLALDLGSFKKNQ